MHQFASMLKRFLLLTFLLTVAYAQSPLGVGQTVPDFTLTNQDGKPTSLKSFRGKAVLLTFLYTTCPYPDKCPTLANKLSQLGVLAEGLGKARGRFAILAVSIDPKKDTPQVLKSYAARMKGDPSTYTFLTGKPTDINKVASCFGVLYWDDSKGVIDHNLRTALIDPNGKVYSVLPGADWKVDEVGAKVKEMLK